MELTLVREMGWTYEDLDRTSGQRIVNTLQMLEAENKVRQQMRKNRKRRG